jgi:glycosyltransferase involved in cell wall biosynthesis
MATTSEAAHSPARTLAGETVLQLAPSLSDDSIGRAALDIASGLLRSGARALVAGGGGRLVGELQALGGEWIELDLGGGLLRRRRTRRRLEPLLHAERVSLVHSHGPDAARIALRAARAARKPILTSYFGTPPAHGARRSPQDWQARGNLVAAVSEFAALSIAERHAIPPEDTVVIPSAIETGWFDPATMEPRRVAEVREAWRIRPEARTVLLPGRLIASQGHLTFVDAVRSLVNGGLRGVVFVIAGDRADDPDYPSLVTDRIEAQGLRPLFRQVGHCADMPAAYAAADLIALPLERAVAFSTIAGEAQAMARPVVASDLGAMPEMLQAPPPGVSGARTGWLAAPYDPLALARSLAAALSLPPREFAAVGMQARHWAQRTFAPERVAAATLSTYLAMLHET